MICDRRIAKQQQTRLFISQRAEKEHKVTSCDYDITLTAIMVLT